VVSRPLPSNHPRLDPLPASRHAGWRR
jgi:hypothetical protein